MTEREKVITIEELLEICRYGTHINIKVSDNGQTAINGVSSLKNSKDRRQMAKWEAFRSSRVYCIAPNIALADLKRSFSDVFCMTIDAMITREEYDDAMKTYNLACGRAKG